MFPPKNHYICPGPHRPEYEKAITIIFLTVLSVLNLSAAEIDSLFSRWEEATGMHRIRLGNELLSLGYDEGLVSEKNLTAEISLSNQRHAYTT